MQLTDDKANVIIMRDFNTCVGEQNSSSNSLGKLDLGKQNERGARLVQFCEQHELTISNTFFQVSKRQRYTWKAPEDTRRVQSWNNLCHQVVVDPWGLPYKLVIKKWVGKRLIPELTLLGKLDTIIDGLFPRDVRIKWPSKV